MAHQVNVVSSTSEEPNNHQCITQMIEEELADFAEKACQTDHINGCRCYIELKDHLLHARDIYRMRRDIRDMRSGLRVDHPSYGEGGWQLTPMQMAIIEMAAYIDRVINKYTGCYCRGFLELIY